MSIRFFRSSSKLRSTREVSSTADFTARAEANKIALDYLRKVVTKHLEKNGRRWVSMESLFSFMKV